MPILNKNKQQNFSVRQDQEGGDQNQAYKHIQKFTQSLLEMFRNLQEYPWGDGEKIDVHDLLDKISKDMDVRKVYKEYPFITDMFFYMIIAGDKALRKWDNALIAESKYKEVVPENREEFLRENSLGKEPFSLEELFDAPPLAEGDVSTAEWCAGDNGVEKSLKQLEDICSDETHLALGEKNLTRLTNLIKFQMKYLPPQKYSEMLPQILERLAVVKEKLSSRKTDTAQMVAKRIVFFEKKYRTIPMNWGNGPEYAVLGQKKHIAGNNNLWIKEQLIWFKKQLSEIISAYRERGDSDSFVRSLQDRIISNSIKISSKRQKEDLVFSKIHENLEEKSVPFPNYRDYIYNGLKASFELWKIIKSRTTNLCYEFLPKSTKQEKNGEKSEKKEDKKKSEKEKAIDDITMGCYTDFINEEIVKYLEGELNCYCLFGLIKKIVIKHAALVLDKEIKQSEKSSQFIKIPLDKLIDPNDPDSKKFDDIITVDKNLDQSAKVELKTLLNVLKNFDKKFYCYICVKHDLQIERHLAETVLGRKTVEELLEKQTKITLKKFQEIIGAHGHYEEDSWSRLADVLCTKIIIYKIFIKVFDNASNHRDPLNSALEYLANNDNYGNGKWREQLTSYLITEFERIKTMSPADILSEKRKFLNAYWKLFLKIITLFENKKKEREERKRKKEARKEGKPKKEEQRNEKTFKQCRIVMKEGVDL